MTLTVKNNTIYIAHGASIRDSTYPSTSKANQYLNEILNHYKNNYASEFLAGVRFRIVGEARGEDQVGLRTTVTKTVETNRKHELDTFNLVQLGGTFEKVGERDEAIGGGNQKVGSDNQ